MTIYKYLLPFHGTIAVSAHHTILHVDSQGDDLYVWALVDPSDDTIRLRVEVLGTGQPADHVSLEHYRGTAKHGPFIWHVFIWEAA